MRDQELTRITANRVYLRSRLRCAGSLCETHNQRPDLPYYIYDGDKPILEYNANNALVGFNLYGKGIDEILERGAYGADNQWHWYFSRQDHEGSVTHLTDAPARSSNGIATTHLVRRRSTHLTGPCKHVPLSITDSSLPAENI